MTHGNAIDVVAGDGRLAGKKVAKGAYDVVVREASDRPTTVRRYAVRVR